MSSASSNKGYVYVLCFGRPTIVQSRDILIDPETARDPITHYVGWTSQEPPTMRLRQHGRDFEQYLVALFPGTPEDEANTKLSSNCPKCGGSLWYYTDVPKDDYLGRPQGK